MNTPFDERILLVVSRGGQLPGKTIPEVAQLIRQKMPNVAGIMLQTHQTTHWQGRWDKDSKAITGVRRIRQWVKAFEAEGLEVHIWGIPRGDDIAAEAEIFVKAATVKGVKSGSLDVEHGRFYWNGTPTQADDLMRRIRQGVGDDYHVSMILDGRNNRPFHWYVKPFIPYVDSLQPMVYPVLFGQTVEKALDTAFENLKPYSKPIAPMLQSYADVPRRPTPQEISAQGNLSFIKGAVGVSYFRLGEDKASIDGKPHMRATEYRAITAVEPPNHTEPTPISYSYQDVINAFAIEAIENCENFIDWISAAGLWPQIPSGAGRNLPYAGPPILSLSAPAKKHRSAIVELLENNDSTTLVQLTVHAQERAERGEICADPIVRPKPKSGANIGIHGAPGIAAPPRDTWEYWIALLKDMGVKWFKQIDDDNLDPASNIFQWSLHLQKNGIIPIIRYMQIEQFPDRLRSNFFKKMKMYADEGILWAEIGNEPNLENEWKSEWRTRQGAGGHPIRRMHHNDINVIRTIAENWLNDAELALAAGVKPGFYAFAPTDWRLQDHQGPPPWSSVMFTDKTIKYLADHHRQRTLDVFDKGAWLAVHAATYEQKLAFDPFGQGQNVWDMTLRSYEIPIKSFERHLGLKDLIVMSTEGGVFTPKSTSMNGHNRLADESAHAQRVQEMFVWLESNSPLQAMCPWCLSVGGKIGHYNDQFKFDGWVEEVNGQLRPRAVVAAMRELRIIHERGVPPEEEAESVKLDVPYTSQWDPTARDHQSDCGPAALAMVLNAGKPSNEWVTVDGLYSRHLQHKGPADFTFVNELLRVSAKEGLNMVSGHFTFHTAIRELKELLDEGRPFIALVNYDKWASTTGIDYHDGHFVVVVGYDEEHVFIHDPLFSGDRRHLGRYLPMSYDLFRRGWESGAEIGNSNYTALIPNKKVANVNA